jgi:hypothetical protein
MAGMCQYLDVTESRVSLGDLAVMNELLDLKDYNDWVTAQWQNEQLAPPPPNPFDVFKR